MATLEIKAVVGIVEFGLAASIVKGDIGSSSSSHSLPIELKIHPALEGCRIAVEYIGETEEWCGQTVRGASGSVLRKVMAVGPTVSLPSVERAERQ